MVTVARNAQTTENHLARPLLTLLSFYPTILVNKLCDSLIFVQVKYFSILMQKLNLSDGRENIGVNALKTKIKHVRWLYSSFTSD